MPVEFRPPHLDILGGVDLELVWLLGNLLGADVVGPSRAPPDDGVVAVVGHSEHPPAVRALADAGPHCLLAETKLVGLALAAVPHTLQAPLHCVEQGLARARQVGSLLRLVRVIGRGRSRGCAGCRATLQQLLQRRLAVQHCHQRACLTWSIDQLLDRGPGVIIRNGPEGGVHCCGSRNIQQHDLLQPVPPADLGALAGVPDAHRLALRRGVALPPDPAGLGVEQVHGHGHPPGPELRGGALQAVEPAVVEGEPVAAGLSPPGGGAAGGALAWR
mmetsp:Transcript_94672/g.276830  ORF Transcript_94672/g.276830 Transcript_94672/m.276830 type:complete len:274 (+) Transcript_94672:263-1084(+)